MTYGRLIMQTTIFTIIICVCLIENDIVSYHYHRADNYRQNGKQFSHNDGNY